MSQLNIHIETIQAGQPRAYADTIYEYIVTFTHQWKVDYIDKTHWIPRKKLEPWDLDIDYAKDMIKNLPNISWKYENDDPERMKFENAFDPYLAAFDKVDPGVYLVKVVSRYDD